MNFFFFLILETVNFDHKITVFQIWNELFIFIAKIPSLQPWKL